MKITAANSTLLLIIFFTIPVQKITAQLSPGDSLFYNKAVSNAINVYHRSTGDQTGLYNGIQYVGYPYPFKEGIPYFLSTEYSPGSIVYYGVSYTGLSLLYDEIAEVVIFQDSTHRMQLHTGKISAFSIAQNNFIYIQKDSSNSIPKSGFYQLLYQGKSAVLKKEVKRITEQNTTEEVQRFVYLKNWYFIKRDNDYLPVNRKKDVFNIFKDRKKEIQQFIKANNLSYKRDEDNLLIKVSAYYDQLTK